MDRDDDKKFKHILIIPKKKIRLKKDQINHSDSYSMVIKHVGQMKVKDE
jgi:hypothetical protein